LLATTLEENDPPAGPFGTATPAVRWWWCIAFFASFFFGEKKEGKKRGKKNMVKTLGREM